MNPLDRTDAERSRDLAVRFQARIRELEQELAREQAMTAVLQARLNEIERVLKGWSL